ncbi:TetR/AcrR family transcriptional regulator C-terminal domain-containing protein [Acetobacterium woodii]|uniref:Transcriptional regulator TetR family n=1 Tax=Acetobacterium woodii (strain ATCC 29683 / DSM 1030 / JCM 2381 / KCTC 1655 / WB1) TaxID=931626 RepID=H6LCE1_ACEWD|nr:TetR/AcrR family transcriptional regulator C-terminal domain-containing protein [Acetobacterium woodii]AFA50256.1 transcriptional regulator TetR family [Acetobacterium woodii DSM 1030]
MSDVSITKKAIAKSFKHILKNKNFEKITIAEITDQCGLNRQTFYYHFQDKYDLINWIVYQEAITVIQKDLTIENWDTKVLELLSTMKEDEHFYQTTLNEINGTEFQNYLFKVTKEIFIEMIARLANDHRTSPEVATAMSLQKKMFTAEFLSYGVVGMIIDWARSGMKQSPEEITSSIKEIINGARMFAVSRYFQGLIKA